MATEKVRFEGADGNELVGQVEMPVDGRPRAWALFAHCFTCTRNILAARNISRALAERGIAVLRFDFAGLGESDGDFADTNFSSNVADLVAAAKYLESAFEAPRILVGHSLGGTAVLAAAPSIPSSVAVATIGSPSTAGHVAHLLEGSREAIERDGEAEVRLAGRPFRIRKQFLDDIDNQALPGSLRTLRRALMVFHSPVDDTVTIDNASEIFSSALHPKSFVTLDKADHLLSDAADSAYVGSVLSAWAAKYLPEATEEAATVAEGDVVARTGADGFRTTVNAGGHTLIADEPASVGGTDTGPTPYGLLSAALAACTSMTLRMYAAHKKIDLAAATVGVTHDRVHAVDCEDCEQTGATKLDRFRRTVVLEGDLTDEQRQRMLEIADRCPVHRTLHSEVRVETELG